MAKKGAPDHLYLFALSFFSLFIELLLIRWIGTEIRIFAYFRNLVLIACFLGLGIGFNLRRWSPGLVWSLVLTALLTLLVHPRAVLWGLSFRKISEYLIFPEFFVWYTKGTSVLKVLLGFAMVAVITVILAGIFVPVGRILGEIFDRSDNRIRDYSINLAGSLFGTWLLAGLSYFNTPPWIWFILGSSGLAALIRPRGRQALVGIACLVPILVLTLQPQDDNTLTFWSPYQKLKVIPKVSPIEKAPYINVAINSVLYMYIFDMSESQIDKYPALYNRADYPYYPYNLPYRFVAHRNRALIVGAGGGNDTAAALRNGFKHVDAVEIDPVIARIGKEFNTEKPYQDPRVNLVIDDARSFLKKTGHTYDFIIFAGLDSHTLTSNFTNINLDSYVYTKEALEEAKQRLAPDGMIALIFQVSRPWIGGKLFDLATEVFGEQPVVINNRLEHMDIFGSGGIMFLCGGSQRIRDLIQANPELKRRVIGRMVSASTFHDVMKETPYDVPTDDWPYLYLQKRRVPTLHLVLMVLMILMMAAAVRLLFKGGRMGPSHFMFLGAAFMLVEVHSISKTALLFGSTWIVNVVIISAIMTMILLANLVVMRFKTGNLRWWYLGLFACLALNYLVPVQDLIFGGWLIRGVVAGAFYSLPLFFAGVIFARSISEVLGVEAAFASNMLGAAVGGMLENTSYLFGLKTMVLIAAGLYLASALALPFVPKREEAGNG